MEANTRIPVELWQMIFSWLPFDDQVRCRLICKEWMEFITTLPQFKAKCLLHLKNFTIQNDQESQSLLQNSSLNFKYLRIGQTFSVKISQPFSAFPSKICETVTHLILNDKNIYTYYREDETFRYFVENLNAFKVLYYLNVGSLLNWLHTASKVSSNFSDICNQSIRVVRTRIIRDAFRLRIDDNRLTGLIEEMLQLVPNVQNIHIAENPGFTTLWGQNSTTDCLSLLQKHSDKIVTFTVCVREQVEQIKTINMPNLQHLVLSSKIRFVSTVLLKQDYDDFIEKFPKLRSFNLWAKNLPDYYCHYFTGLSLKPDMVLNINVLSLFKNLTTLDIIFGNDYRYNCFENHPAQPFCLESMKYLQLKLYSNCLCLECFDTLLKSLPNLTRSKYGFLWFSSYDQANFPSGFAMAYINSIFDNFHDRNLFDLDIETSDIFEPNINWPVMENLKNFRIDCKRFYGPQENWERFFEMLVYVKQLTIIGENGLRNFHVEDILGNNMPFLQEFEIIDCYRDDTKIITRNGIQMKMKYVLEADYYCYCYSDHDSNSSD